MAYDEMLAIRIRQLIKGKAGFEEKKMFGGVGYLIHGNMACGVHKDSLIVRVGPENYEASLREAHTRIFDITGKPMTGWIMVYPEGCDSEKKLETWVQRGVNYALSLPSK